MADPAWAAMLEPGPSPAKSFDPRNQPPFLQHCIAPGTALANSVRIKMHGEIRLKKWKAFTAEEAIHLSRGFMFRAQIGALISGKDSLIDSRGAMKWRLLGLFPLASASGPDITRSAIGRWLLESIWLPPMLLSENGAEWRGSSVTLRRFGVSSTVQMDLDSEGRLKSLVMPRWGNPGNGPFGLHPCGGIVESERSFSGYIIPSRLRVGWHFGTPRWADGEFFRVTVDDASFQ